MRTIYRHWSKILLSKICKYPQCCLMAQDGHKYCTKHSKYETAIITNQYEQATKWKQLDNLISPNEYMYHTGRWRQLRDATIKEHPYCVICNSDERLTVDHIIAPEGDEELFYSSDNLQVLCKYHHDCKTQLEGVEKRMQRRNNA
jgi:5-methylcytosine-specific restriction endonuclease McrA